jgi:hypothetical protein
MDGQAQAVGGIVVPIGIDINPMQADLQKASSAMTLWRAKQEEHVRQIRNFGLYMSAAITAPVTMFAYRAVQESIAAEQISKRLNIAIRNTGGAAGITRHEIDSLASSMLKLTNFSDEAVRSAAASLLKFKGIRGEIYRDTLKLSADMAAAMGTDIGSAAQLLGRSLVNPGRDNEMLRRAGVVFTNTEREKMKNLAESGNTVGAQRMMLSAIQERMGGAAVGMAEPFTQAKNAFGELQEAAGDYLRKQYLLDEAAGILRDGFLKLSDNLAKSNGPLLSLASGLVLTLSKLGPAFLTFGQYIRSINEVKGFVRSFRGLSGASDMASKGLTILGAGSDVASVLPERARATWLREEARRTSARAAEMAAAVSPALATGRFQKASVYAQAEEAERLKELARAQHGRASVLAQRAAMAEAAAAGAAGGAFAGQLPKQGSRLLASGGQLAGAGGLSAFLASPAVLAAAIAAATFMASKIVVNAAASFVYGPSSEDPILKRAKRKIFGETPDYVKEAGVNKQIAEEAKAKREMYFDEVAQRKEEAASRQKEVEEMLAGSRAQIQAQREQIQGLDDRTAYSQLQTIRQKRETFSGRFGLAEGVGEGFGLDEIEKWQRDMLLNTTDKEAMKRIMERAAQMAALVVQEATLRDQIVESQKESVKQSKIIAQEMLAAQRARELETLTVQDMNDSRKKNLMKALDPAMFEAWKTRQELANGPALERKELAKSGLPEDFTTSDLIKWSRAQALNVGLTESERAEVERVRTKATGLLETEAVLKNTLRSQTREGLGAQLSRSLSEGGPAVLDAVKGFLETGFFRTSEQGGFQVGTQGQQQGSEWDMVRQIVASQGQKEEKKFDWKTSSLASTAVEGSLEAYRANNARYGMANDTKSIKDNTAKQIEVAKNTLEELKKIANGGGMTKLTINLVEAI